MVKAFSNSISVNKQRSNIHNRDGNMLPAKSLLRFTLGKCHAASALLFFCTLAQIADRKVLKYFVSLLPKFGC